MSAITKDGSTEGAHLRQARRTADRLGMRGPAFDDPDPGLPPPGFSNLWEAFGDLSSARQVGMGPCPVAYADVRAYARLRRLRFSQWELGVLRALDRLWISIAYEKKE